MDEHYVQAASDNLPAVDNDMLLEFFVKNNDYISAEIRGVKASRSSKQQYGDSSIGYVQLLRKENMCTVKARITPEHKIHNRNYNVTAVIDEDKEEISSASCSDCAAAAGGCKHSIAFLFWLHRKSEEPAPTSVECYWKCSALSKVGRSTTFIRATDMNAGMSSTTVPVINNFKELVMVQGALKMSSGILFDSPPDYILNMSLFHLALSYKKITDPTDISNESFESFCASKMTNDMCREIEIMSRAQNKSAVWEKVRFGRITASKIYEAAKSKTLFGSLTETVMGATIPLKLDAVLRGQRLETEVLAVVGARTDMSYERCGIFLKSSDPFFGASPDAINEEYVFEIKCPSKDSTVKNYLHDGHLTPKPFSQIQLQMHLSGKKKGFFCVASPHFEQNCEVEIVAVEYDRDYCENIIKQSRHFWNEAIFKILIK